MLIKIGDENSILSVFTDEDLGLSLETLHSVFPDATNLANPVYDPEKVLMRINNGKLYNPDGWNLNTIYMAYYGSRPTTPIQGASVSKKPRIEVEKEEKPVDEILAAKVSKYALYYTKDDNFKRSAIPLTKRLAATFRHGENKKIQEGDIIILRSYKYNNLEVVSRAVKFIDEHDAIILQAEEDICDSELIYEAIEPKKGMGYLLMGYSIVHSGTNHMSFSAGIIASDMTSRLRFAGSSGSFKGDSGGSCWSEEGKLIGMQNEVEKVPHTKDDKGRPASPASGGRCSIVPIINIRSYILNYLPAEPEVEFDE